MNDALSLLLIIANFVVNNATSLVGFMMPMVVELLAKDVHDEKERVYASMILCLLAAVLLHWKELIVNLDSGVFIFLADLFKWFGIIFAESQVVFKLYFKNSSLRDLVNEKITNTIPPDIKEEVKPEIKN
jgi:hypothetical protein